MAKRFFQPIGWALLSAAVYATAFNGWLLFMPFYWFSRLMDFTDNSFKEYCQFWFDLEFLG